jgi:hypothetical protein
MRALLVVALVGIAGLGCFVGPEPSLLLLAGTALTGIGMIARRARPAQKERD